MFHFVPFQTDIGIGVEYASTSFGYLILAGFFGSLTVGLAAQRTSAITMLAVVQLVVTCASFALWASRTRLTSVGGRGFTASPPPATRRSPRSS